MVGLPRTPPIWQAVVEAHERELMMQQRDRDLAGRPVGVTPAELMARQLRLAQAIAGERRSEIEDAIRAYAKKLLAQRAAVVKDARLWDQARALLVRAGAEPPR